MARLMVDERSRDHLKLRISRAGNRENQERVVNVIKRMTAMDAPREASGHYHWHVKVPDIGKIIVDGILIKTFYGLNENYPGGTEYKIAGNRFVRA